MLPSRTRNANPGTAPTNTSNANPTVASIDTSIANPQEESPLFARIPGEIRDQIFDLALTAYSGKQEPFAKVSYYYRPGFRYADQKLDTALLRTCRRIYQEARLIPFENYERVEWHDRGPSRAEATSFARGDALSPWLTSLHLFTQQFWLESYSWRAQARRIALPQNLCHLKITIRHRYVHSVEIPPNLVAIWVHISSFGSYKLLYSPELPIYLDETPSLGSGRDSLLSKIVSFLGFLPMRGGADSKICVVTGGGGRVLLHSYLMQNRREIMESR